MTRGAGNDGLTPEQQQLVKETLHLVEAIARSVYRRYPRAEYDELCAAGYEALVGRARAYDPGRDATFSTFVWQRVVFAVRDAAKAPPFSSAALGALDVVDELEDRTSVFGGDDEGFELHVLESESDIGAGYTLAFAGDLIRRRGEEGLVLLEERARILISLRAAVASLPAEDRRLFHLRLLDRRPTLEVAAALGVSKSTVDRRCRALRERLRRMLEAQEIRSASAL